MIWKPSKGCGVSLFENNAHTLKVIDESDSGIQQCCVINDQTCLCLCCVENGGPGRRRTLNHPPTLKGGATRELGEPSEDKVIVVMLGLFPEYLGFFTLFSK